MVKTRRRFVKHEYWRAHGDHRRQCHRTSFAVTERGRRNVLIPVQVEQCHHFVDTFEHGGRVKSERGRTERDLLFGAGAEDLMVGILEYESDVRGHFAHAMLRYVEPIHLHDSLCGLDQPVQMLGERSLA